MSDIKDLFARFEAGDFTATSEFGARDEEIQSNIRVKGFPKHEYKEKANQRVLIPKELALPVDPRTGRPSPQYNEKTKFRPAKSWTTSVKLVKYMVSKNKDAIPNFLRRANLPEDTVWDVDNYDGPITKIDRAIFKGDTVPRLLTETVANINSKAITGFDNPMPFRVNIHRDSWGKIIGTDFDENGKPNGEVPNWIKIAQVFSSMNIAEIKEVTELRKAKDPEWSKKWKTDNPDLKGLDIVEINDTTFKESVVKVIRRQGLVSEEFPNNYMVAYIFDMDNDTGLIKGAGNISGMSSKDLDENMFLLKRSKSINEMLESFKFGQANASNDLFDDFYEMHFTGPTSVSDGPSKKMLVAKDTTVSFPALSISSEKDPNREQSRGYSPGFCDQLCNLIRVKQDETEDIEFRFKGSTRLRDLDGEVEEMLMKEFAELNLLVDRSRYLSDATLRRFKDLFIDCYGPEANDFFDELEGGLMKTVEGSVSEEELIQGHKDFQEEYGDLEEEEEIDTKVSMSDLDAAKGETEDLPV